jgi:serine protease Do
VIPAVVNVSAVQRAGSPIADEAGTASRGELLRKFFDNLEAGPSPNIASRSIGSGFIIDRAGYVVTEDHVIENADKITVTFQDGTKRTARIIGRDPKTDLALL